MQHSYLSTACLHGEHGRCRRVCKFCGARCNCTNKGCRCTKIQTVIPVVMDMPLSNIDLESMAPEVAVMLKSVEKPRTNLGSSGPPGRTD